MMERGAIGELIPEKGKDGKYRWGPDREWVEETSVWHGNRNKVATFYGPKAIRLERVALFLTTEQS